MKTDYDVIIVGAGPAGASCAKHLVDNGVKTLVIEKCKFPKNKCSCGILSERASNYIKKKFTDTELSGIIESKEEVKLFYLNDKINFNQIFNNEKWLNINRLNFDLLLFKNREIIIKDNFEYIFHIENASNIEIICNYKNKNIKLKSKYLIGADGFYSKVRRNLQNNFKLRKHIVIILYIFNIKYIDLPINKYICIFNEKNLSDAYIFLFRKKENILYFGISYIPICRDKKKYYYENTLKYLKERFNFAGSFKSQKSVLFTRDFKNRFFFGYNNSLLIGESSGLITNLGEGITSALYSGQCLSKLLINNFGNNNSILELYKKEIINEINYVNNRHFLFY